MLGRVVPQCSCEDEVGGESLVVDLGRPAAVVTDVRVADGEADRVVGAAEGRVARSEHRFDFGVGSLLDKDAVVVRGHVVGVPVEGRGPVSDRGEVLAGSD